MTKQQEVLQPLQKPVRKKQDSSFILSFESHLAKPSISSGVSSSALSTRPRNLQPVLIADKNYYQLGPETATSEIFSLSITLYSAKNLVHVSSSFSLHLQSLLVSLQLFPSTTNLNTQNGYFFHYNIFGNEIKSEVFQDLMHPEFHPERSSLRLRTTVQLLRSYFETFHPIQLTLCSGNDIIGQTQIPIHKIIKPLQQKSGMDKIFDVLTEEFNLNFAPSSGNERRSTGDDEVSQATVRVDVKLARENPPMHHEEKPNNRTRSNSANHHHSNNSLVEQGNR